MFINRRMKYLTIMPCHIICILCIMIINNQILNIIASSSSSSTISNNNNNNNNHNRIQFDSNIQCTNFLGDIAYGGACYSTNDNSFTKSLKESDTDFEDPEIKEWHFHVYWFQHNKEQKDAALRIRSELIDIVRRKEFIVVLNGIDDSILPQLNTSNVPLVNNDPIGPHPVGSYEVWTPKESIAEALSFFMLRRGELSILLHPLTVHTIQDHTGRSMWLGKSFNLDYTVLCENCDEDHPQYPELKLGYSAGR